MSNYVFFWKPEEKYGEFSQWYLSDFKVLEPRFADDEYPLLRGMIENTYNSAEQYMMSHKARLFKDKETYKKIRKSNSPRGQKSFGRGIVGFDVEIWNKHCNKIVEDANFYKFSQNNYLKNLLLETDDAILVEASPYDKVWGIGLGPDHPNIEDETKWKGQNLLGKALMRAREKIKKGD